MVVHPQIYTLICSHVLISSAILTNLLIILWLYYVTFNKLFIVKETLRMSFQICFVVRQ